MSLPILERHIKMNHHFVNEYYKSVVGVMVLNNIIFQDLESYLSQYKLTYQQFNILRILKGQYPNSVSLNLIKERMLHQQSDVSRLVDRLIVAEFVDKQLDKENKRKVSISLSEKGYKLINSLDVNNRGFKSIMEHLNDEEIDQFNDLVGKIISNIERIA